MQNLPFILAALACPVGMGVMMFFMMRPGAKQAPGQHDTTAQEIAQLRAEVTRLRTQQQHDAAGERKSL